MMRSLISQLLHACSIELDFIALRLRQQLEKLDFRGLCECFSRMVKRLKPTTVLFCIIDGINCFERRDWLDDCTHVINLLQDLVYDGEGANLLLLMTSPLRTRHLSSMFPPESRLSVIGENLSGRSRMTDRQISEASRRPQRAAQEEILSSLRAQHNIDSLEWDGLDDASDSDGVWSPDG